MSEKGMDTVLSTEIAQDELPLPENNGLDSSPADDGVVIQVRGDLKVPSHGSAQGARVDTPIIPEIHPSYVIANSGPADEVIAVFYWSHSFTSKWFEYSRVTVEAGKTENLRAPSNSLYYSKVVIYNNTDEVAFVTVQRAR